MVWAGGIKTNSRWVWSMGCVCVNQGVSVDAVVHALLHMHCPHCCIHAFQRHTTQEMQWEYAVIDSDEVNAFVVPGGKVCVYTGLLGILKNRDELAAVLAHETAHVVARHAGERMSQQLLLQLVRTTLFMVLGIEVPSSIFYLLFFLPYGRYDGWIACGV